MASDQFPSSTHTDLRQALSPAYIKSLQVFYIALGVGVLVFFFVAFFMFIQSVDTLAPDDDRIIQMLTIVHIVYAALGYGAVPVVFNKMVARGRGSPGSAVVPEQALGILRLAAVVRLAIMEGIAFFGLVVLFIAARGGILLAFPVYWLNLFSTVIMLSFVMLTFPTRDRLEELYQAKLLT